MKKRVVSSIVFLCVVAANACWTGSSAASPWTSADTYTNIIPSPLLLAMSIDTVFVYPTPASAGPALAYLERSPAAALTHGSSELATNTAGENATPHADADGSSGKSRTRPVPSRARDTAIAVTLSSAGPLEAEPGKIITARFVVANETGEEAPLRESVTCPPGWARIASAEPDFTLGAGEVVVRLVTFHIPPDCPAGVHDFWYEVMDPAAPYLGGETAFSITVLPQLDLGSRVMTAPRTVVAGGEFTVQVALTNTGNTRAVTRVRATVRPDYDYRIEPTELLIPSGERRTVTVWVKTQKQLPQRTMCMIVLKATTEDETGQTAAIEEVITVDVIPRVTRLADPYYRLPSWVKMTVAADGSSAGGQVEISGSGPIAGDTGRNLSYVLRQASTPSVGRYASWNEYWLTYRGHHLEVNLGDRVFALSPLVQRFYYGKGAGATMWVRNVALGAYYARSRSAEPTHREAGGFVSLRVKPGLSVKANILEKEDISYVAAADSRHRIASVQGDYAPTPNARFELEYGVDANDAPGNDGYRFAANGVFRNRFYYSLEKVHAGPAFHGYTADSDFTLGTFQYPVKPGVTLRLSYRRHANNLDLNPLKLTASNERQVTTGVSYIATPRTRLNIDLQDFSRWDGFEAPAYDYGERTIRASLGYSLSHFSLYLSGEHGYSQNDLADLRTSLGRYSLSASIRPDARQSYNIYAGFGNSKYSEVPRKSDDVGIAARWHLTRDLDMNLNYHMSGTPSLIENTYRILTHSVYYMLPNRHMVTLRTSVWGGRDGRKTDTAVLLSYSIPAPIPMGRRKSVGTLKGRVFDAELGTRKGVANVIVTADGQAAVTDDSGEFEFPSLEPGVYSLQVDARSIGLGRVTEGRSPFVVSVEGGKTARIDIGVVRSCTITGEVLMFDPEPNGADSEDDAEPAETGDPVLVGLGKGRGLPRGAYGLPDVLVEITNGEYYLTQYTNSGGEFSFAGLRPGRWTARIYPEDLPHYYFVEAEETAADMAAGDETHMAFRILPRQRRINIMDEGEVKRQRR